MAKIRPNEASKAAIRNGCFTSRGAGSLGEENFRFGVANLAPQAGYQVSDSNH